MTETVPIDGTCAPGFEEVRAEFARNFTERGEVGAAVHIVHEGRVVVDLVGGWADGARTRPWDRDTLAGVYSVGKGVLATLLLRLVDRGLIHLDAPVASVWPEFAAGGKGAVTVRHALSHRAGVPGIRDPLTDDDLYDWQRMTSALAATEPLLPPGGQHAYHVNTFGHLIGELVRRVGGAMPDEELRRAAAPLDADVWFGVPPGEQHRCAEVVWDAPTTAPHFDLTQLDGDALLNAASHFNPPGYSSFGQINTPRWRALPLGSTAGHASAVGLARWYQALLDGTLVSHDLLDEATRPQASGPCPILRDDVTFGLGFTLTTPRRPLGPHPGAFGHFGTGGALGFADPVGGVAFGYVMNHTCPRWQSARNRALIDTLYRVDGLTRV